MICQVCYALRNLATDSDTQALIGRLGALPLLRDVMSRAHGETLVATLACLRNLSIYRGNEVTSALYDVIHVNENEEMYCMSS